MKTSRSHILCLSMMIVAVIITFLLTVSIERYEEFGDELLQDHLFSKGLDSWKTRGNADNNITVEKDGTLHLHSKTKAYVSVSQQVTNPPAKGLLKLSAMIMTEQVSPGPKGWNKARLILDRHDDQGNWQKLPHHAASIDGTTQWQKYEQIFRMVPDTARMYVTAGLAKASGSMKIRNISLKRIAINPLFENIRPVVFIVWAGLILWMLSFYISRHPKSLTALMTILILSGILAGTLAPAVSKTRLQGNVKEYALDIGTHLRLLDNDSARDIMQTHPYDLYIKHMEIGKIGHFILFGILTFLLLSSRSQVPISLITTDAALLACVTELLQFFTEGRATRLSDLGLDLGGVLSALLIFIIISKVKSSSEEAANSTRE